MSKERRMKQTMAMLDNVKLPATCLANADTLNFYEQCRLLCNKNKDLLLQAKTDEQSEMRKFYIQLYSKMMLKLAKLAFFEEMEQKLRDEEAEKEKDKPKS